MSIDASMQDDGFAAPNGAGDTVAADPMADLLDRATHRLRIDRELQLEVRQELKSHLDEAIAQFRSAGRDEPAARVEAIAELGNPDDLAEQLWSANRRRIRIRAAAAWVARLLLPPVAIALIVVLAYGAVASWVVLNYITQRTYGFFLPPGHQQILDHVRSSALAGGSEQAKELWAVDDLPWERRIAAARELAERHPTDLALYAHYACLAQSRSLTTTPAADEDDGNAIPIVEKTALEETIAVLREGERREPDNALYPLLLAGALFETSSVGNREDPSLKVHKRGQKDPDYWWRADVFDPPRYEAALEALHRAAAKPYYRAYTRELLHRKLDGVPARRLPDVWLRLSQEVSALLPALNRQHTAYRGGALRATEAARDGRREEEDRLLRDLRLLAGATAADATFGVELKVALGAEDLAMEAEAFTRQLLGDNAGAAVAWKRYHAVHDAHAAAYRKSVAPHDRAKAGILYGLLEERTGADFDVAPMRRAEYAAIDALGVAVISSAVLLLASLFAAWGLFAWLRTPKDWKPVRLFVGWRRVGWIVLLGAILPLAIYLIYARLTPLGGRQYGLNETLGDVIFEYAVVTFGVIALLVALTRRAIRARAAEVGLLARTPRDRSSFRLSATATAATLAAAACLIAAVLISLLVADLPAVPRKREWLVPAMLVGVCWPLLALAGFMVRKRGGAEASARRLFFGGTLARSAFAVLLLAATALSLVGLPLRVVESRNVAAAVISPQTGEPRFFLSELNAAWRDRRDAAISQRAALLRESQ